MPDRGRPTIGIDASRAVSDAPTGTEAYSAHLIRTLVPLLAPGHDLRLYTREAPARPLHDPLPAGTSVETRTIPFPRLWTHVRLSWEMLRHPPDLLFIPSHVLPVVRPKHTLVTVHDLGYRRFPEAHPPSQRRYLEASTRWNVRTATHILADSVATRDAIVEAYGASPEKITVVYPGFEPNLTPVVDRDALEAALRRYGIEGDYVLFIGRIHPRKNLARLIEAFARVRTDRPGISLVLAGPQGWLAEPIRRRVAELGLTDSVLFPGFIAGEDKAALISGARVFAYPSLYEGFGFPALEAQACGTPLLTSTTSSLPEVAGEGGLLVDPEDTDAIADGLRRLLADQGLRDTLVAQGFENLRRFSWDRAAREVREVVAGLLTSP